MCESQGNPLARITLASGLPSPPCKQGLRPCLHGVGDPGLVGLVSFVFTLWGAQNKRNLPHLTGVPHSM